LKPGNLSLAARVGIYTGDVVVGDLIGAGPAQEQAVVGETPNLAARLQRSAEAGTVVIGPRTRRLIGEGFECEDLGGKTFAGVSESIRVWRVLRPGSKASRFDILRGAALVPLVGREEEVGILAKRWDMAKRSKGQVVTLLG